MSLLGAASAVAASLTGWPRTTRIATCAFALARLISNEKRCTLSTRKPATDYQKNPDPRKQLLEICGRAPVSLPLRPRRPASAPPAARNGLLKFKIILPLPDVSLSPNSRAHFRVVAKHKKAQREAACAACEGLPKLRASNAIEQTTFYHSSSRRRDGDNLLASLKGAFDGLTDYGLIDDDAGLLHMPIRKEVDKDNPRVEIDICIRQEKPK